MDAAANAVRKAFSGESTTTTTGTNEEAPVNVQSTAETTDKDTTVDESVAPAVEHETVVKKHETREQEAVQRERHQDHYHTTIQPLKDREVQATQHDTEEAPTEYREINNDSTAADAKAKAEKARSGFTDETTEAATQESYSKEAAQVDEKVHHHLHETIQPVIEKETIVPSVTHKTIPVKEKIQEDTQDHGVTTRSAISVDEFKNRLDGDEKPTRVIDGQPDVDAS